MYSAPYDRRKALHAFNPICPEEAPTYQYEIRRHDAGSRFIAVYYGNGPLNVNMHCGYFKNPELWKMMYGTFGILSASSDEYRTRHCRVKHAKWHHEASFSH